MIEALPNTGLPVTGGAPLINASETLKQSQTPLGPVDAVTVDAIEGALDGLTISSDGLADGFIDGRGGWSLTEAVGDIEKAGEVELSATEGV